MISPLRILLVVTLLAGVAVALRSEPPPAQQVIWTFAQTHADALTSPDAAGVTPLEAYEQATGTSAAVQQVEPRAMSLRLFGLLAAERSEDLPDVVQLESATAARFLARPAGTIGLLPLDSYLDRDDLRKRFLPQRLAAWQRNGVTYGLPMDVHPVALAYRVDLWTEAGLDPTTARTWPQFAAICREYADYWQAHGHPERAALELARTRSDHLTLMLQQQRLDFSGNLSDPRVAETVWFAANLLADGAARPTSEGHGRWARDFAAGDVGVLWMPDWRVAHLERAAPELAGKVGLMPLPTFSEADAPTATWGGTMLAIPATVPDPEAAWRLATFVATSDAVLAGRRRVTTVLPALPDRWERTDATDDYFVTPSRRIFAALAAEIPAFHLSPLTLAASGHLALALAATCDDLEAGVDPETARQNLVDRLETAQRDLDRRADFAAR